jgi:hypothetical protein
MNIVIFLAGVAFVLFIFFKVKKGMKETAATNNALLAEHFITSEDISTNKVLSLDIRNSIIEIMRLGGFPNMPEEEVARQFNSESRFHQLCLIAIALEAQNYPPLVDGEVWHDVNNPFLISENNKQIEPTAYRFKSKVGKLIDINRPPLVMSGRGIKEAEYE